MQGFENNRNNRFRFVWTQRGHGDILRFMKNKPIREAEKKQMRERFMKLRVTVAEESSIRLAAAESRVTVSQFFRYAMNLAGVKL